MAENNETLAAAIIQISDAVSALLESGLNRKAIEVLLHDSTKIPKRDIKLILDTLPKLKKMYCG